jgi:hypothetical protein
VEAKSPKIVVADRSELAGNLYRLLFAPFGAIVVVRRRFEDVFPLFHRKERIDIAIFNSNIFGNKFEETLSAFRADSCLNKAKKVFLCGDIGSEAPWHEKLSSINNSCIILRPFHPDELAAAVRRMLSEKNV